MGSLGSPWIWAQATGAGSPAAAAYLALRRWCGGLTLSPSRPAPDWEILWIIVVGPLLLALLATLVQGPGAVLRQLVDVPGHVRLVREAMTRVWRAAGMVTVLLTLTVLSWTASQCVGFFFEDAERGRSDLLMLKRGRTPVELVAEHAATAAVTPLRDVAGLGDSLPILATALAIVLSAGRLRAVSKGLGPAGGPLRLNGFEQEGVSAWQGVVGTCLGLQLLYRLFCRLAGGGDLPVGNCLLIEVAIIPFLMLVCDGFLLAWVLVEIRDGEPSEDFSSRFDPSRAFGLMPAACLGCLAALPGRYAATALVLASQHFPASWMATEPGRVLRWSLGPGLVWIQTASLVVMGIVGAIAWSGGGWGEAWLGFRRSLRREGGRMAVATAMAVVACAGLSAVAYALVQILPPAGWVLPAADAYAHYATLPVGLWTLAVFIVLAEQVLPVARSAEVERAAESPESEIEAAPIPNAG
ncbi:hypothetical protein [Paludisphaera rhizosphaerae]|uniref:hypothetical protein n=1 Tax=Paludisphaera rhizosphaerae TaxID=2711216 RepID=UPI0013E9BCE5|nr:hypothetical protein [Paludisphaera rhizosphaerae]